MLIFLLHLAFGRRQRVAAAVPWLDEEEAPRVVVVVVVVVVPATGRSFGRTTSPWRESEGVGESV